jgi:hypothetical protein
MEFKILSSRSAYVNGRNGLRPEFRFQITCGKTDPGSIVTPKKWDSADRLRRDTRVKGVRYFSVVEGA